MKRLALVLTLTTLASSLTGCGTSINIEDIPLVPALSQKEVIDYYKKSMEYDTIATRTVLPNVVTYELSEVTGDAKNLAINEAYKIESLIAMNDVGVGGVLSENIHQYIKYVLDDKILTRKDVTAVNEALGCYFIDIEYTISPQTTGTFTSNIQYLGINGAFEENYSTGEVTIDNAFMTNANGNIQKYLVQNPYYSRQVSTVEGVRQSPLDVSLYNEVAGMSLTQTAMMPKLSMIYSYPTAGSLGGYGIYPQGAFTLKEFGYNRSEMSGTATLRYVFKKDLMNPTKLDFQNVYVTSYKLDNAPEIDEQTVAPDFVFTEAEKIVERADRAICNNDISALSSGKIYDDIGLAVLYGNMRNYCYNQKHMTKVNSILGRTDHMYLLDFESTVQEGPKSSTTDGTYVLKGYLVVQQEDTEFHITDYLVTSMEMVSEPEIDTESTILKRLAALNLTGEVTDDAKTGIKELMSNLYKASTERQLQGMYDCFDTDTNLLSSTHREYLNAQLRSWLLKKGTNSSSTYTGVISQWIGGADNQVEFFTNELIEYNGHNLGLYMQNYYLVSNYDNKWVIDEMKVVESKDVTGDELNSIRESIASGKSITVENADNNVRDESNSISEQSLPSTNESLEDNNSQKSETSDASNTSDTETTTSDDGWE